jgi:hypothetical protein
MIERVEDAVRLFGSGTEVQRGLSAPRPDFEPRSCGYALTERTRELEECEAFVTGHEAIRSFGEREKFVASTHIVTRAIRV